VVTGDFIAYFAAAATAAGTLIGLLFVAVSLRPESLRGEAGVPEAQAVSNAAFIALANGFIVALVALIPDTSLGYTAAVTALLSILFTLRLHLRLAWHASAVAELALSMAAYLSQLVVGAALAARPHSQTLVHVVAYLLIASFAVGLSRAWSLLQGRYRVPKSGSPAHG
jgi:hypothetical protein